MLETSASTKRNVRFSSSSTEMVRVGNFRSSFSSGSANRKLHGAFGVVKTFSEPNKSLIAVARVRKVLEISVSVENLGVTRGGFLSQSFFM